MSEQMDKRVAIVTGGSRGIGEAIVRRLAKDGLHVVAIARNAEKLKAVVDAVKSEGGSVESLVADLADSKSLNDAIEQLGDRLGRIDVVVNNAGITKDGLFIRMEDADFDTVINTNLKSAFVVCRAAGRLIMRSKSGRIINIASVSGVMGNRGQVNYAASKSGMIGMSKSIAKELATKGVTCNVVAPGFIKTDMTDVLIEQVKDIAREMIPLKRFGEADDIAACVSYLASPEASYVTGQVICVDGGMAM
jgi:3-oxoacyl-[acyl-carrier protein] reductase